jgi:hypothetical protein
MRPAVLQAATWLTIVGAIVSALWLASNDPGWPEWNSLSVDHVAPFGATGMIGHPGASGPLRPGRPR